MPDEFLLNRVEGLKSEWASDLIALQSARTGRQGFAPFDDRKLRAFCELMSSRLIDGEVEF